MKLYSILIIAFSGVLLMSCNNGQLKKQIHESETSDLIRINQAGYYPSLGKRFTVADDRATTFMLVNKDGKVVFKGDLSEEQLWDPSGETLRKGDFSSFSKEGTYFIHVPGSGNSYPF